MRESNDSYSLLKCLRELREDKNGTNDVTAACRKTRENLWSVYGLEALIDATPPPSEYFGDMHCDWWWAELSSVTTFGVAYPSSLIPL